MSKPEITVLHGTDGKYHLFDRCKNKACDWPPCDTRMQAEVEAKAMIADLQQLREDEQSEAFGGILGCDEAGDLLLDSRF
jgi:hypothetical protein